MGSQVDRARVDKCDHSRSAVTDTDEEWNREGTKVIGHREHIECPDCDLSDWFVRLK